MQFLWRSIIHGVYNLPMGRCSFEMRSLDVHHHHHLVVLCMITWGWKVCCYAFSQGSRSDWSDSICCHLLLSRSNRSYFICFFFLGGSKCHCHSETDLARVQGLNLSTRPFQLLVDGIILLLLLAFSFLLLHLSLFALDVLMLVGSATVWASVNSGEQI